MSFTLERTHIAGGTFNNVAGNLSQVFNSHTVQVAGSQASEGRQNILASTPTVSFAGAIRGSSASGRQQQGRHPYASRETNHPAVYRLKSARRRSGDVSESQLPHDVPDAALGDADHIPGTVFNSVAGNMTQLNVTSYQTSAMDMFHGYVAMEALHDSGERSAEPSCYPGTRISVLKELASWSTDTGWESTLLWLHGAAGVGKSAIAQMFAGNCQSNRKLGASFFFARSHPRRGTWNRLIPTIAYQLATSIPEFRFPLEEIIESDKLIVGRTLAVQFRRLLVDPFRMAPDLLFKPVIILEGLDECADHKVQQQIIRLFVQAIRDGQLPVRILITSRPEPHLREILETNAARAISRQFSLSADHAAYEDIRTYLQAEFIRIHTESIARGMDLGATWPGTHALDHLVTKSSAIFVYATTVVLFIEDEYSHPADQLESVLRLDPASTAPLDDLYTQIVSLRLRPEPRNLRILHEIWRGGMARVRSLNPEEIDLVLELRRGDSRLALRGLHALLYVPPARTGPGVYFGVTFLHASFQDFLWDQRRSGRWCVATRWLQCGSPNLLAYKFP